MSSSINANIVAAAIGAAVAFVSVAVTVIYNNIQKHTKQNEHMQMQSKIQNMNKDIMDLRNEVDRLSKLQKQQKNKRRSRRKMSNGSNMVLNDFDTDIDTYSTAGTDIGDDEFYDCSDLEDDTDTPNGVNGEDICNDALMSIDRMAGSGTQQQFIYNTLKDLLTNNSDNVEIVWRFARACHTLTEIETDAEKKKEIFKEGIEACEKILELHNHINLYKWYAILIGSQTQLLPIKEKIPEAYRYKEYIEKALNLGPSDSLLHHLLGRFKFEISELSWLERKMAATLFSEPPNATYDEALKHFEDADRLSKEPLIENKLFMGKCYISLCRYQEASDCLKIITTLSTDSEKEQKAQEEAQALLSKCVGYIK